MTGETKAVGGWEGIYEVSDYGIVFACERTVSRRNGTTQRFSRRVLRPSRNDKGYLQVRLSSPQRRAIAPVHRLVALAFIANPGNLPEVNHLDGVKTNNVSDNLEWTDPRGNRKHAWDTGLRTREHLPVKIGSANGSSVLDEATVAEIRRSYAAGASIRGLAKRFSVDKHTMQSVVHGRSWKHVPAAPPTGDQPEQEG